MEKKMTKKIDHDQKETAIEAVKSEGTMLAGAKAAGITVRTLNNEMNRSEVFKRRILAARVEGYRNIADKAIEMIKLYASGDVLKTDRNVLTANIALANAYEPGFRGQTVVQGKIDHDVRVITAVPRPNYQIIEPEKKLLDKPSKSMLKSSKKKVKIVDQEGNYIGTKVETVEDVIEGEVIE